MLALWWRVLVWMGLSLVTRYCRWVIVSLSLCIERSPTPAMALTLQGELVQAGFPDELWRLEDAIEFLEVEEFASLADLRGAPHACCAHRLFHSVGVWLVCLTGAPVSVLRERAVAFGLHSEDVEFLVAAAGRCCFVKRRTAVVDVAPAPPAARIEPAPPVLPPPSFCSRSSHAATWRLRRLGREPQGNC